MPLISNAVDREILITFEHLRREFKAVEDAEFKAGYTGKDADLEALIVAAVEARYKPMQRIIDLFRRAVPPTCQPNCVCLTCGRTFFIDRLDSTPDNPHHCPACGTVTLVTLSEGLPPPLVRDTEVF